MDLINVAQNSSKLFAVFYPVMTFIFLKCGEFHDWPKVC